MKKMLLIGLLVASSAISFSKSGEGDGFYNLYQMTHTAVETPEMHKDLGMDENEKTIVKNIINDGWYDLKVLEADKLKEVFAIDKLMIDGPGNKKDIDKHFAEIEKISEKMEKVYNNARTELKKYIDVDKLK